MIRPGKPGGPTPTGRPAARREGLDRLLLEQGGRKQRAGPRRRRLRPVHALWLATLYGASGVTVVRFLFGIEGETPTIVGIAAFAIAFIVFLDDDGGPI